MVERLHTAGHWPQLFEPIRRAGRKLADWFAPSSDASVTTDHYEINMELAGVETDDIDIEMHDSALVVKGEKHYEHEESGRSYFFSEREYGAFQRTFRLPPDADANRIDASFRNGVLTIRIAKIAAATNEGKKVKVRVAG